MNNQGDLGTCLRNVSNKQETLVQVGKAGPPKNRSLQIFTEAIKSLNNWKKIVWLSFASTFTQIGGGG